MVGGIEHGFVGESGLSARLRQGRSALRASRGGMRGGLRPGQNPGDDPLPAETRSAEGCSAGRRAGGRQGSVYRSGGIVQGV